MSGCINIRERERERESVCVCVIGHKNIGKNITGTGTDRDDLNDITLYTFYFYF